MIPVPNHACFISASKEKITKIFNSQLIFSYPCMYYRKDTDESDVGQHMYLIEQAPPTNDDIEIHHTADREEQLPSPQQQTDIDLQSQLQNWNFHTVHI